MKTNIISIKYEDRFNPKTFSGKSYSYYVGADAKVGDLVLAPTKYGERVAMVTEINVADSKVEFIKPYMKLITDKIDKETYLQNDAIVKAA
ncbi:MAG: hypothetical protein HFJ52_08855 [Clostridia bacterium]|nr:hypothetical protein [Clostridia bacterium]